MTFESLVITIYHISKSLTKINIEQKFYFNYNIELLVISSLPYIKIAKNINFYKENQVRRREDLSNYLSYNKNDQIITTNKFLF